MNYFRMSGAFALASLLWIGACQSGSKPDKDFLSVDGNRIVDEKGRTVILNGINYVTKDPERYYDNINDDQLFRHFRNCGINCVRFGLSWKGIEPEPGKINEKYLQEVDKRVKLAEENDIRLILDMHQDLYGGKYGNGAPDWATLDEGLPHKTGDVWSDAYLLSPAIHKAFDNFWNNAPASDGVGIQDHYIFVWKTIAKRYANSPSVAGFDIMNEPFCGSESQSVLYKLLETYGTIIAESTGNTPSINELLDMWGTKQKRIEALKNLNEKDSYRRIVNSAYDEVRTFEQGPLTQFYQKVRDVIREVNKKHILFLEHSYFCNLGVKSSFLIPKDRDGKNDPLCVYAPHAYDLVTDTDAAATPGCQRVEVIFEHIFEMGKGKRTPIVVGEWGAYYIGGEYLQPALHIIGLIEKALAGHTYWAYWENIEKQDYFDKVISRYYPMEINGTLICYNNDYSNGKFVVEWEEDNRESVSRIYIPNIDTLKNMKINLTPSSNVKITPIEGCSAGYLEIFPIEKKRSLSIPLQIQTAHKKTGGA
jgi:endoglycosylceramidase